ncbi:MAG: phage integrase SAM-like domain-containing protein [Verrucomicrobia bacterium]|nr:phage integrase SAM-like domain-containing protein [Cytophagales bacterium]
MTYTFSLSFWLQKIKNVDLRYISCRLTICGETAEIATGIRINPECWDTETKRIRPAWFTDKTERVKALQLNRKLDTLQETLEHLEKDLRLKKQTVTASLIKTIYKGGSAVDVSRIGFLDVFGQMIAFQKEEQNTEEGKKSSTIRTYQIRYNNVAAFIAWRYKKKDLMLSEIKRDFQEEAKYYFFTRHYCEQPKKIGLGSEQVKKHLECIRKVFKFACKKGYIKEDPTEPVTARRVKYKKKVKIYLDFDELIQMAKHTYTPDDLLAIGYESSQNLENITATTQMVSDCFVFGCLTGLAYHEQHMLGSEHMVSGFDRRKWLKLERGKQEYLDKDYIWIPLMKDCLRILEKYKNHPACLLKGKLLPVPSNAEYNRAIKDVAKILKIVKHLTTHTARKTFTTLFVNSLQDPKTASLIIGDTEEVLRDHYLHIQHQTIADKMDEFEKKIAEKQAAFQRKSG